MYTHKKNDEVANQISLSNKIAANEEERKFKFQYTKSIDCTKMMRDFNVECLTLNYQLKRLVADKDSHQVLAPKRTEKIEVIPNTYMFFKVVTKDMLAPGKINFAYGDGQYVRARRPSYLRSPTVESPTAPQQKARMNRTKVELSAYFSVSEKNREPTKEQCDKSIDSPSGTITMPILGKDKFENEEVYVSLFSITGCVVHLTVQFPDLKI